MLLPRTLIIIRVIFGPDLREYEYLYAGDIAALVKKHIDSGNMTKVINMLIEDGWVDVFPASENPRRTTGRKPRYCYKRTPKGEEEYLALTKLLNGYGIRLAGRR